LSGRRRSRTYWRRSPSVKSFWKHYTRSQG
jgi:hypothetical protein